MSQQPEVPQTVTAAYFDAPTVITKALGAGEINATFLVEEASTERPLAVIQRLSHVFGQAILQDFKTVTTYLTEHDWQVPLLISTHDGADFVEYEGAIWRAMTYIDSEGQLEAKPTAEDYESYGSLLGRLHSSLKDLDYHPAFELPHFHDTPYHAGYLGKIHDKLPDAESRQFATDLLEAYHQLPSIFDQESQVIHGDPKTSNMLFRGGKPFTYIDYDTIMVASPMIDLGDMLRSLAENSLLAGQSVPVTMLARTIEAYRATAQPHINPDQFQKVGFAAMQLISLELAMRYIYDIVDDSYWVWDNVNYNTRRDSNMARAALQWRIYAYQ